MDRVTSRQLRAVRGVAASGVTTLLAATAHTLAGAGAPSLGLIAVAATVAAPLAVLFVGHRPSLLRTSAAVLVAQAVFHVVFAMFSQPSAVVYAPMAHAAMHAAPSVTMSPMSHDAAHLMGWPMIVAHALAALVTVLLLHRAERMLRALGRGIRRLLPTLWVQPPRPLVGRVVRVASDRIAVPAPPFASVVSRRGPPVAFC